MDGDSEILTYQEALQFLSEMARKGSVTATVHLERILRPGKAERDIDDELARILGDE
jgi:hypothetical protein